MSTSVIRYSRDDTSGFVESQLKGQPILNALLEIEGLEGMGYQLQPGGYQNQLPRKICGEGGSREGLGTTRAKLTWFEPTIFFQRYPFKKQAKWAQHVQD